jgi:hypothetical protein
MTKARELSDYTGLQADIANASNLTTGTIPTARITTLASSKLSGDIPTANLPAGSVLQVSETTAILITGVITDGTVRTFLSLSFTPKSATSTLYVEGGLGMQVYGNNNTNSLEWVVLISKGSTELKRIVNHDNNNHVNTFHRTSPLNNPRHSEVSGNTTARTYTVKCHKVQSSVGRLAFSNSEYPMNYLRVTEVEN